MQIEVELKQNSSRRGLVHQKGGYGGEMAIAKGIQTTLESITGRQESENNLKQI